MVASFRASAAQLAQGIDVERAGCSGHGSVVHRTPEPHRAPTGELIGEVIAVDHFGNAITTSSDSGGQLLCAAWRSRWSRTYAELEPGEAGQWSASTGMIEIVGERDGRLRNVVDRGTQVSLR